jgi:hypothetical protein
VFGSILEFDNPEKMMVLNTEKGEKLPTHRLKHGKGEAL